MQQIQPKQNIDFKYAKLYSKMYFVLEGLDPPTYLQLVYQLSHSDPTYITIIVVIVITIKCNGVNSAALCLSIKEGMPLSFLSCGDHSGQKPQLNRSRLWFGQESSCPDPLSASSSFGTLLRIQRNTHRQKQTAKRCNHKTNCRRRKKASQTSRLND